MLQYKISQISGRRVRKVTIKTIDKAAAELLRLYAALDRQAIDLTDAYTKKRLAGKEGVTWAMFPRTGAFRKPTPILDDIVRREGAILLSAGYNMLRELLKKYELTKVPTRSLKIEGVFVGEAAITIHRPKVGFDPGEKYVVIGDQVLKAGYDHVGSMPTVGRDGKLAWSSPRDWVNDKFHALEKVDANLLKVISDLRKYA